MKYILPALLLLGVLWNPAPAQASTDGNATVVLSIEARDCSKGMVQCQVLADAYIRVVAGSQVEETSTDHYGRAYVTLYVTTPIAIQVYLNNEVAAEVYAGTISGYYYYELALDYLPPALYLPVVRR